jgi:hypothetical protein
MCASGPNLLREIALVHAAMHLPKPQALTPSPIVLSGTSVPFLHITARDCNSGCLSGALPMAFQSLCRSNHSMAACMSAQLDLYEQMRLCLV